MSEPYVAVIEYRELDTGEVGREYIAALQLPEIHLVEQGGQGPPGPPGPPGDATVEISGDPDNRLERGSDQGLYVRDDLIPDPLAYYILARS